MSTVFHRSYLSLGISLFLLATVEAPAYAFTQRSPITSVGHELITVYAARRTGGMWLEPHHNQITGESASCRTCDQYSTKNHHTWSAVMGQRWVDIGGYNVTDMKCLNATMQDNNDSQFNHALRRKCDIGYSGLVTTQRGIIARIRDSFMKAVRSGDQKIWFRDGGAITLRFKAIASSFHLGMALHPLQDSFSEEHTTRSPDFRRFIDIKTYVDTPGVASHAHDKTPADRYKYTWLGVQPNEKHGDYAFRTMHSNAYTNLKPSALAAVEASSDLMRAFQASRMAPHHAEKYFNEVMNKWMQLDSTAQAVANRAASTEKVAHRDRASSKHTVGALREFVAGGISAAVHKMCAIDMSVEDKRIACLRQSGREPMYSEFPKICWPDHTCKEDGFGHARDAITRSANAFGKAMQDIGHAFAQVFQTIGDTISHGFHSFDRCFRESGDFGRRSGNAALDRSLQRSNTFWNELGTALDALSVSERKQVVDRDWPRLRNEINRQMGVVREQQCNRVRNWFTKSSSKDKGQNNCRANFNSAVSALSSRLEQTYQTHINKAVHAVARSGGGGVDLSELHKEHPVHQELLVDPHHPIQQPEQETTQAVPK